MLFDFERIIYFSFCICDRLSVINSDVNACFILQAAKLEKMKIPPHEMFKLEVDKYSMFDEKVRDFSSYRVWFSFPSCTYLFVYVYSNLVPNFQGSAINVARGGKERKKRWHMNFAREQGLCWPSFQGYFPSTFLCTFIVHFLWLLLLQSKIDIVGRNVYDVHSQICYCGARQGIHLRVQTPQLCQNWCFLERYCVSCSLLPTVLLTPGKGSLKGLYA